MLCRGCDKDHFIYKACDVCKLVDGVTDQKKVVWCNTRQAYICEKHKKDYTKRALAALIRVKQKILHL